MVAGSRASSMVAELRAQRQRLTSLEDRVRRAREKVAEIDTWDPDVIPVLNDEFLHAPTVRQWANELLEILTGQDYPLGRLVGHSIPVGGMDDVDAVLRERERPAPLKSRSFTPLDLGLVPSIEEIYGEGEAGSVTPGPGGETEDSGPGSEEAASSKAEADGVDVPGREGK